MRRMLGFYPCDACCYVGRKFDEAVMADQQFPVQQDQGASAIDAFVADRQSMWKFFNSLTLYAVVALAMLLCAMALFLT